MTASPFQRKKRKGEESSSSEDDTTNDEKAITLTRGGEGNNANLTYGPSAGSLLMPAAAGALSTAAVCYDLLSSSSDEEN